MAVRAPEQGSPSYVEAYPRISALQAWREGKRGRSHIIWRNQHAHAIGTAEVEWSAASELIIRPCIQDWQYIPSTAQDIELQIAWKGSTRDNKRPYFRCPECSREHDVIIYGDTDWFCKHCHDLRNRSERLDVVVRISEKMTLIEHEIGAGRPAGMREAAYQAKQAEWAELMRKLGKRARRTASREYLSIITSEWVAAGPFVEHLEGKVAR